MKHHAISLSPRRVCNSSPCGQLLGVPGAIRPTTSRNVSGELPFMTSARRPGQGSRGPAGYRLPSPAVLTSKQLYHRPWSPHGYDCNYDSIAMYHIECISYIAIYIYRERDNNRWEYTCNVPRTAHVESSRVSAPVGVCSCCVRRPVAPPCLAPPLRQPVLGPRHRPPHRRPGPGIVGC